MDNLPFTDAQHLKMIEVDAKKRYSAFHNFVCLELSSSQNQHVQRSLPSIAPFVISASLGINIASVMKLAIFHELGDSALVAYRIVLIRSSFQNDFACSIWLLSYMPPALIPGLHVGSITTHLPFYFAHHRRWTR